MANAVVERKLRQELLPYLVSAGRLGRQPLYLAYRFYSTTHEALVALASYGISNPLMATVLGSTGGEQVAQASLAGTGGVVISASVLAVVLWAALKTYVGRAEGEKRSTLAESCRREFRRFEVRLRTELAKADPLPGLIAIQQDIAALVDRHIAESAWPWPGPDPAPAVAAAVEERVLRLLKEFEAGWTTLPPVQQAA